MMVGTVVAVEAGHERIRGRTTIHEVERLDAEHGLDVLGLYDDELVRLGGKWLFASRTLSLLAYSDVPSAYVTVAGPPVA
jgi:hypothetical protein